MDDRPGTEKAEGSKDCHAPLIPFRPLFTDSTHLHSFTNGITQPLLFIIPRVLYRAALDRHPNRGPGKRESCAGCSSYARPVPIGRGREGGQEPFPASFESHRSSKFSNLGNFVGFFRFFYKTLYFQYFYSIV